MTIVRQLPGARSPTPASPVLPSPTDPPLGLSGRTPLPELASCRRILVVKLDFVGDWVLGLPFLHELRRHAPFAHITAVVLDRVFELAVACRSVDRVVAVRGGCVDTAASTSTADTAAFLSDYRRGRAGTPTSTALPGLRRAAERALSSASRSAAPGASGA
jgi:hypothetical protein